MRNNISEVYTSISELNDGRRSPTRKGGAFSKKLTLTQNLTLTRSNPTQPSPIRRGLTRLSVFGRGNIPPPNRRRWPQAGGGSRRGFRKGLVGERGKKWIMKKDCLLQPFFMFSFLFLTFFLQFLFDFSNC